MNPNLLVVAFIVIVALLGMNYFFRVLPARRRAEEQRVFVKALHAEEPWALAKLVEDCGLATLQCRFEYGNREYPRSCTCGRSSGMLICLTHRSPHGGSAHCIVDQPHRECTDSHVVGSFVVLWEKPELTDDDLDVDHGVFGWSYKLSMPMPDQGSHGPWTVDVLLNGVDTQVLATRTHGTNALTIERVKSVA